ncbi:hypothetical protein EDB85DRAFT_1370591 [Lactarius pseudohatsudake]|nr:hypothetical protein EDB85DRAFT_1370591 [Lactarius pseudohatsudake]
MLSIALLFCRCMYSHVSLLRAGGTHTSSIVTTRFSFAPITTGCGVRHTFKAYLEILCEWLLGRGDSGQTPHPWRHQSGAKRALDII